MSVRFELEQVSDFVGMRSRCYCRGGVARAIALKHALLANCPEVLERAEYRKVIDFAKRHYGWK